MGIFTRTEKGKGLMKRYNKLQTKHDKDQVALSEAGIRYNQSKDDLVRFNERYGNIVQLFQD